MKKELHEKRTPWMELTKKKSKEFQKYQNHPTDHISEEQFEEQSGW